jgi:hypothetical protein
MPRKVRNTQNNRAELHVHRIYHSGTAALCCQSSESRCFEFRRETQDVVVIF